MRLHAAAFSAVLALGLLALASQAAPLDAQAFGNPHDVTTVFAQQWAEPGSADLLDVFDPRGVLLAFDGREHRDLDPPKLLATVDQVREDAIGGGVRLLRVVPVGDNNTRAFAELLWEAVMAGTSEAVEHTVYLGLVQRDERWWISEIRLLR